MKWKLCRKGVKGCPMEEPDARQCPFGYVWVDEHDDYVLNCISTTDGRKKMRLIDADSVTLDMPMYNSFSVVMPLEERFRIMLERQPTVEAIPIEWIKEWCNTQSGKSLEERLLKRYGVLTLLEDWEKENE